MTKLEVINISHIYSVVPTNDYQGLTLNKQRYKLCHEYNSNATIFNASNAPYMYSTKKQLQITNKI